MTTLGTHPDKELFLDDDASPLVDDRLAVGEEVLIGQHPAQSPLGLPLLGDVERHPEPGLAVRTSAPAQPVPPTALGAVAVLEVHEPIAGKRQLRGLLQGALAVHRVDEVDEWAGHELLSGPAEEPRPAAVERREVADCVRAADEIALEVEFKRADASLVLDPLGVPRVPIQFTESLPVGGSSLRGNSRSSCDSTGWRGAGCPQPCVWLVWGTE